MDRVARFSLGVEYDVEPVAGRLLHRPCEGSRRIQIHLLDDVERMRTSYLRDTPQLIARDFERLEVLPVAKPHGLCGRERNRREQACHGDTGEDVSIHEGGGWDLGAGGYAFRAATC